MIETKITTVEQERSKASAEDDLKRPDPDEKTAAALIEKNIKGTNGKGGAPNENSKKHD